MDGSWSGELRGGAFVDVFLYRMERWMDFRMVIIMSPKKQKKK